jgi:hypothetical protein
MLTGRNKKKFRYNHDSITIVRVGNSAGLVGYKFTLPKVKPFLTRN